MSPRAICISCAHVSVWTAGLEDNLSALACPADAVSVGLLRWDRGMLPVAAAEQFDVIIGADWYADIDAVVAARSILISFLTCEVCFSPITTRT